MLRIYHSNSLDTLRDVLVELIRRDPNPDPFKSETILVQSPGMAQWLKLEMAERIGIAANIDFPLPASFLWDVFKRVLPDVPERSSYSKSTMSWVLMRLLPQYIDEPEFLILKRYMDQDDNVLRLYHLCSKIADLFDQYLVYRPDWIADWEQGNNSPATEDTLWQPVLWRAIVEDITARHLPHWHRANMFDTFVGGLTRYSGDELPSRIFIFGISALAENYLQAVEALSQKVEVHLMISNPCQHFWGDIVDPSYLMKLSRQWLVKQQDSQANLYQTGHPLLASMGKLGRDYLYLVQQMNAPEVMLFTTPEYDTILHALQSDILELEDRSSQSGFFGREKEAPRSEAPLEFSTSDTSLQLHQAHSPMREIEILHDQLLAMFEADSGLKPRDVIVMVPDVANYTPYIDAVFGNQKDTHRLPYAISDRSVEMELPLISSFLQLISLDKSRFSVSDVMQVLELPATLRRFGILDQQLEDIRLWLMKTGINWGVDDLFRQELGTLAFRENSWTFGFDRLFSGYAMGETESTWQGISTFNGVGGLQADLLGRLYEFFDQVRHLRSQLTTCRMCEDWLQLLNELILTFYEPDDLDHEAISLIHQSFETWQTTLLEADFSQAIPVEIVQDFFKNTLGQQQSSQRFLSGQINFCTLMPMRSIPFKVVCLLGMNDGAYPRSIAPMGFDLMETYTRRGDRSRRDDDRYLFLEAVLSAKEKLYISYVARSILDNSERIPSVLVSELLEYCESAYQIADTDESLIKQLSTEHPLTPYSQSYFDSSSVLFSYRSDWALNPQAGLSDESFIRPLPELDIDELDLSDLISFYRHPVKHFFHQRLQVFLRNEYRNLEDEEPFSLSGLDDYQLRKLLLSTALKKEPLEPIQQKVLMGGQLPVGLAGKAVIARRVQDVTELVEKLGPYLEGDVEQVEIRLPIANLELRGWINHLYPSGAVSYDAVKVRGKHHFSLWIEHLALCAAGYQKRSIYRGLSEKITFLPVPQGSAMEQLDELISVYRLGLQAPLSWLPEPAWKWLSWRGKDEDRALLEAQKSFESSLEGDFVDPYVQRVYPDWSSIQPGVQEWSTRLFKDMINYLDTDDED